MCHPVSPSASSTLHPLPAAKTHNRMAKKRQSDNDGTSTPGRARTGRVPDWTAGTSILWDRTRHCPWLKQISEEQLQGFTAGILTQEGVVRLYCCAHGPGIRLARESGHPAR